jgi:hypothetical protein
MRLLQHIARGGMIPLRVFLPHWGGTDSRRARGVGSDTGEGEQEGSRSFLKKAPEIVCRGRSLPVNNGLKSQTSFASFRQKTSLFWPP